MAILKRFYCQPKKLGSTQTWILLVLDVSILDLQSSFFKITMMFNVQWAMDKLMDLNPMFRLWKKLFNNVFIMCPTFWTHKLAKLVMVQIMGFVEDEKTFLTLTFTKIRLQNHLWKQDYKIVYVNIWILWFKCLHNLFISLTRFFTMMPS
jgi:hypothetical protein